MSSEDLMKMANEERRKAQDIRKQAESERAKVRDLQNDMNRIEQVAVGLDRQAEGHEHNAEEYNREFIEKQKEEQEERMRQQQDHRGFIRKAAEDSIRHGGLF